MVASFASKIAATAWYAPRPAVPPATPPPVASSRRWSAPSTSPRPAGFPCAPSSPCRSKPALASSVTATTAPSTGTSPSSPRPRSTPPPRISAAPSSRAEPDATSPSPTATCPPSPGERIRIGDVDLEVVRAAAPCKLLDDVIGTGARTALRGRAGSVFRALSSGSIAVGGPVCLAPRAGAPAIDSAEHVYSRVVHGFDDLEVSDGDVVAPALIPRALTAGELGFSHGATQGFKADGGTTYVEHGRPTRGEWYVNDDGRFGSFLPPSYRASYDLRWMVEDGVIVGLRFTELDRGSRFDGRYQE